MQPPGSKKELLQLKTERVTNQSEKAMESSKGNCIQAQEIGARTLVALDGQREQLGSIGKRMYEIEDNMKEAEDVMRAMENDRKSDCNIC